ncbi:cyclic pyranopterin monophosphate synthase MoaC [Bacillus alveayuensis]|uniref:Cyclic pyranopterin monophosphate synthase n=1 Tax=Aeribacillus alveayuensis TaxID=279215 RepID=A0ABT9VRP6_9BACI|nr:cyclic pyranopterin monophosphate synthase MoaC [Bacillus alveayuensis]MDQ0163659.1 cyclic pyranopterin phosphate synthase [Bacillus alveayuensis]
MSEFTHFNEQGRAKMVDVSEKVDSVRIAIAKSRVIVSKEVYEKIVHNKVNKGDVLSVAQVAGIMAAKNTPMIVPMCHPIPLKAVDITFEWDINEKEYILGITAQVKTKGATGVEMEALTAASACALTVYDMCKALDKGLVIGPTFLVKKTGGKSGEYIREGSVL